MKPPLPLEDSAEDMLRSCHAKMRQFSAILVRTIDAWHADESHPQVPAAAASLGRYFREALPMHARDEDESISPRLVVAHPELAPMLAELEQGHVALQTLLPPVLAALDELAANGAPEDPELHEHVAALVEHLEAHAAMEERGWFRLFAELPEAERRAVRQEMAARRAR